MVVIRSFRFDTALGLLAAILLLGWCGCARPTRQFVPSETAGIDAVRRAMEAWKAGLPTGPVPDSKPVIHVTDSGRKPGQTLADYEILGETRGTAGRSYAVTLQLANPKETVKTKYLVVGIDPLWVFRQEDYELLMHWDHYMPEKPVEEAGESAKESE